jgi:hypothetical protein
MTTPLNPSLYRKLKSLYGAVKIGPNVGEKFLAKAVHGLEGEKLLTISHDGEYYRLSCPFCSDTRFRLYVNHMFGKIDGHGRRMTFLAICFNEGCMSKGNNMTDFLEALADTGWIENANIRHGVEVSEEAREVILPGPCLRLDRLPAEHPACRYLASRNFDPAFLGRRYGVSYCTESHYYLARHRITIPIYENGLLKGWQCRYVGELDWKGPEKKHLPPKYFSTPGGQFRSRCVYNWESMKRWQTGVVMEGPSDVWRFGAMSGCVFGNTITDAQRKRLLAVFRRRTLVLLLDPEEFDSHSTSRAVRHFEKFMGPQKFCAIKLPRGTDPGSLDRDFLRGYVRDEARAMGVKVSYRKVA